MESSYVRTVCFHTYTKPAWDASRLSFLDVFCNALRWSQDQAPGMQVPAGNRPLSDLLLPVFLWAGCSGVIGRLHKLSDGVSTSAASPLGTASLDPVHCRPTQTSHKLKEQEARSTILNVHPWSLTRFAPQSPWFLTHRESALSKPSDLSRAEPCDCSIQSLSSHGSWAAPGFLSLGTGSNSIPLSCYSAIFITHYIYNFFLNLSLVVLYVCVYINFLRVLLPLSAQDKIAM